MNRARLEYLARKILPYVNAEHFDMTMWGGNCPNSCGTAACAAGHHALSKDGQKQGFYMLLDKQLNDFGKEYIVGAYIAYQGLEDMDACAAFYDIPYGDACELFDPSYYTASEYNRLTYSSEISAAAVAARIEALLATA